MRETILLFHFTDQSRRNKLVKALLPLRVRVVADISEEDYKKPVGYLAGVKELSSEGGTMDLPELPEEKPHPQKGIMGEMMVMAGFSSGRIDQVLRAVRKSGVPVPYKAALTASNQTWDAYRLFEEIKSEHETMSGK